MATVMYIPEKKQSLGAMKGVMSYVCQEKKTRDPVTGQRFVTGVHCLGDNACREFLATTLAATLTVPVLMAQGHGQQERLRLRDGSGHTRQVPISPPGSLGHEHLGQHCTACHLCISKCPSRVLKPALLEYGLSGMMQPMMYFDKGFCNYDCTVCSDVCPNGAILPLSVEEKHRTQVGRVVFVEDFCIVHTDGTSCGACSEHCPTQAVSMIPYRDGLTIPHTNPQICVGCGRRPVKIFLKFLVHRIIRGKRIFQLADSRQIPFGILLGDHAIGIRLVFPVAILSADRPKGRVRSF